MIDDGRNINLERGQLSGFGAGMQVEQPGEAWPLEPARPALPVTRPTVVEQTATYYDMPVVKPPPWRWYIPAYFYTGGVAGAAAALAAAGQVAGAESLAPLLRKARWMTATSYAASGGLLIADLGRPARFLNMLRVFRPTSPMNLGTWLLSAGGVASGMALAGDLLGLRRSAAAAGLTSGLLGLPLATYTAVLLANTAMPLWKQTRRELPLLFGASAAASAASLLELIGPSTAREQRVVRRFSIAAKTVEVVTAHAVSRAARSTRAGAPLRSGRTGTLWRSAAALGIASLATSLFFGRSNGGRLLAGALGTASAVAIKYAVVEGGKESARDPRATFEQQRAAAGARAGR